MYKLFSQHLSKIKTNLQPCASNALVLYYSTDNFPPVVPVLFFQNCNIVKLCNRNQLPDNYIQTESSHFIIDLKLFFCVLLLTQRNMPAVL